VFCACEKTQLFYVVLCVVRTVHKFDFGLVINGTSNKCRLVFVTKKKLLHAAIEGHVFGGICASPSYRRRNC